ncbi:MULTISPECIES: FUSC family protein [unclassified Aureimonas]|uniref:FUSC family protein n=1 Tax=unclassified Aureimonas TaxID=2615206 RepID=UPI0006FE4D05|nr:MULTISPECIES: FUSC family protein [unclassified Aureimonas]KQT66204.1 hypothetical protein ASG62_19385 [Aureimonas sp. Leaf427]KQT72392.1 hypothetical protein ASG54_03755 [Aureimonas sp. Leaf460]
MPHRQPTALTFGLTRLAVTSDPGLGKLRMASRVTLTLALVVCALFAAHAVLALPPSAYGIAMITAMQGALAVREADARAQLRTRLLCGLAGFSAAALAVALEPVPRIADALFVALVFAAVYGRKYGARWNAVGMFAFMCYFISVYLHPASNDLPAVALAIALSGTVSHLIRNHVLPEHPDSDFRRAVEAVGQRIDELKDAVEDGRRRGWPVEARREAVNRQMQLGDAILSAEGYMPAEALSGEATRGPMGELAVALFDLHLASESLLVADLAEPGDGESGVEAAEHRTVAGERLDEARRLVEARARAAPREAFLRAAQKPPAMPAAPEGALITDPQLRLAIQVALAAAIAMAGGLLVSQTRFFWAILTAFLVFTNTQSRGDTVFRALNRTLGTMVGIVAGIGLATLVGGDVPVSIGLSILFVFAGFYLLQISYGAMTFFVTLVISLMYGLIGQFSVDLLVLRLEETLVGALAGAFVSFAVLPQRASATAEAAVTALLDALDDMLRAAAERVETGSGRSLLALSRRLDHRYAALATAARALGPHWNLVRKPGPIRIALLRFMALAYWTRRLARAFSDRPIPPESRDDLLAAIAALRDRIAALRRPGLLASMRRRAPDLSRRTRDGALSAASDDPLLALGVLSHVIASIDGATPEAKEGKSIGTPAAISTEEGTHGKGPRRIS